MCKAWVSFKKINLKFPDAVPEEIERHLGAFESEKEARRVARRYCRRQYLYSFPYIGTPQLFIWREKNPNGARHPWSAELVERPAKSAGADVIRIHRRMNAEISPLVAAISA